MVHIMYRNNENERYWLKTHQYIDLRFILWSGRTQSGTDATNHSMHGQHIGPFHDAV